MTSPEPPRAVITDRVSDWADVVSRRFVVELTELKHSWPHAKSFRVDMGKLVRAGGIGTKLTDEMIQSPDTSIGHIRDALHQRCMYEVTSGKLNISLVEVRPHNYTYVTPISRIRSNHANTLVSVDGIIRRVSQPVAHLVRAVYRCRSCGALTDPIPQPRKQAEEPDVCPRCERKARFDLVQNRSTFVDYQRVQITENPEGAAGTQPQPLDVDMHGDIVGTVQPGDRVRITGIVRTQRQTHGGLKSPDFGFFLEGLAIKTEEKSYEEVRIDESDERAIRDLVARSDVCDLVGTSIAPSVYGHEHVKRAIALQLFGGVRKQMRDGTPRRGDVHVLLVGDPGIAKSVILRYAVKVAPRGVYTSGQGTTKAGLTAAAIKEEFNDGRWTIEAGALVLADTGLAAVDDLDKMSDTDRSGLHEAMEQQTVSLAKAGITATLRSRCALLGAANPKRGRFDPYLPISDQINMPPSLLSRFDLIFVLQDRADPDADARLSRHVLQNHRPRDTENGTGTPAAETVDPELLRRWVKLGRDLKPVLNDAAMEAIHQFYLNMRGGARGVNAPLPITPRQEEGVIRLAEASARMRLSATVEAEDVRIAINLMDLCLRDVAYDPDSGRFDIDRLYAGAGKNERDLEREIETTIRKADGRIRVSEVFESFLGQEYGLDQIERTLIRMERSSGYSIANGVVYRNEN